MKRLIVSLFAILMLSGVVMAEEGGAFFKWGSLEFTYPLSNASVISLYDWWRAEGLMGVETRLVKFEVFNLNFGAVTSFKANGMPFASVDVAIAQITPIYPKILSGLGVWAGYDFKLNEYYSGIKAIVPLW